MRDWLFGIVIVLVSPAVAVGIVAGLVWVGLRIGFNAIDYKLMEYILYED